jgi:hypothetical protein
MQTSLLVVEEDTKVLVGAIRDLVGATRVVEVVVVITRAVEVVVIRVVARMVDTNSKLPNRITINKQTTSNNHIKVMGATSNSHRQQLLLGTNRLQLDTNNRALLVMINTNRPTNSSKATEPTQVSKQFLLYPFL